MTKTTRAPRVAELASDEGYNLAGAPVLLAKLTAYISRATFAQLAAIATAAGGEYSKHNTAFMFPMDQPEAREEFARSARVILTNPAPAPDAPATATPYTDAPSVETPPAIRVSTSRPISSTITDRTPAGYGPTQPALF